MSRLSMIALTLMAAACGSSGGDGGANGIALPPRTAEITSENASMVASEVVGAVSDAQYVSDLGTLASPSVSTTGGVSLAELDVEAPPTMAAALAREPVDCAVSGTVDFSAEIATPGTLSEGDSISFLFDECLDEDGVELDGGFDFTVESFDGNVATGSFELTVAIVLSNLMFTDVESSTSTSMDGSMRLTLSTMNASTISIIVETEMLTITSGAETVTLEDASLTLTIDILLGTSTFTVTGLVESSAFNGVVEISATGAPLILSAGGTPSEGEIVITGADGATLTVRIISEQQVELHLDSDGNGTIDEVITTDWESLRG